MRKINKKGVFGFTDFIGQIGSFLNGIISVVPAPIKFLIFLLMIVGFSYILSILFMAFGVYCNSANEPVKLNTNLLTGSLSLMDSIPAINEIGQTSIKAEEQNAFGEICGGGGVSDGYYTDKLGIRHNITGEMHFYSGTHCTKCEPVKLYEYQRNDNNTITGSNRVGLAFRTYCEPTQLIYPIADKDKSLIQKTTCGGNWGSCEPPKHYRYNPNIDVYECDDENCVGVTVGSAWDEILASKGANLLYPTTNGERDYSGNGFVGITCVELKPRLGVFGIDLFSFSAWLFITIIVLLFWGWQRIAG